MSIYKVLLVGFVSFVLMACASKPTGKVLIEPLRAEPKLLMSVKALELKDLRQQRAMAVINSEANMRVKNLADMINPWLQESVLTSPAGRNTMTVEILNATTYVTQYSMSFESEAVVEWRVTLKSKTKTWTKTYQTGINEDGPLQMSQEKITQNMNVMFLTLLDRTLRDPEFKSALSQRF